jgi:hypothetical protein
MRKMESIKEFIDEHLDLTLDTNFLWGAFGMAVLTTVVVLMTMFIVKDKRITGYYLTNTNESALVGNTCIYANSNWYPDEKVLCTTDTQKAIDAVKQLNETLK